jgi:hypothetical protein
MLPGFRFLFAAVVLTTSMLIFGLGTAALLRAAHQEFASIPSRRAPLEPTFAQRSDDRPVLAMIRAVADQKDTDSPATGDAPVTIPPLEQATAVSTPVEPENPGTEPDKVAALTDVTTPAENSSSPDMPKPEASASEIAVQTEAPAEEPSPTVETTVAAIAEIAPNQVAVTEQPAAPIDDSTRLAETKIATLGGPPVTIEPRTPSKAAPAVVKKNVQARRAVKRRKIAQRPRATQQTSQKPVDPFGQPPVR